jgi:hypothetical protein
MANMNLKPENAYSEICYGEIISVSRRVVVDVFENDLPPPFILYSRW